jgi:hypothetical protein
MIRSSGCVRRSDSHGSEFRSSRRPPAASELGRMRSTPLGMRVLVRAVRQRLMIPAAKPGHWTGALLHALTTGEQDHFEARANVRHRLGFVPQSSMFLQVNLQFGTVLGTRRANFSSLESTPDKPPGPRYIAASIVLSYSHRILNVLWILWPEGIQSPPPTRRVGSTTSPGNLNGKGPSYLLEPPMSSRAIDSLIWSKPSGSHAP